MTRILRKGLPCLASLTLSVTAQHAFAAELDCSRASGGTQTAICAHDALRKLDLRLSSVYGKLVSAQPRQRGALRQTQLDWLKARDQCAADVSCLTGKYHERIETLRAQWRDVVAYKPDSVDRQALEDLRQAVEAMRRADPEFPLEKVLESLRIKSGITTFSNVRDDDSPDNIAHFPTARPAGVTIDEWRALQASRIEGGGENGTASYTLIPIDGRARRDLVIASYSGGTGLFTITSVVRRHGGKFEGAYASLQAEEAAGADEDIGQSYLYSENGRGANQSAVWIRLRGRVYAAYRNSYYGEDNVYLLRPLTIVGEVPKLTIRYRYELSLPRKQQRVDQKTATTLAPALHAALTRALGRVDKARAHDVGDGKAPLCPIPATVTGDDRLDYQAYGPGHYTFEIVGDMPIWLGSQCYLGRMVNWFGGYSARDGLYAQLWMRKPGDQAEQTYSVRGVRTVIRVDTSIARVEGDNA